MKLRSILMIALVGSLPVSISSTGNEGSSPEQGERYLVTRENGQPTESVVFTNAASGEGVSKVFQKDKKFEPTEIQIKVNEKIEFVNNDSVSHNVYCGGSKFSFNVGSQVPGDRDLVEFTKAGKFLVRCAVHLDMKLYVTVVE